MQKISALRAVTTKPELALLLGINPSFLTNILYRIKPASQYSSFKIPKKSGGDRTIYAPSNDLKSIQTALSILLQDCAEEIVKSRGPKFVSTLSHGFVRERSILTNAVMHLNKKNVLNIDLKDFFDEFNFGRVRGFFISNRNFRLSPATATVIAQIACHDNKLPQGSPCSPVISNLITHSLDIRLASLARENSCTYTRYADDITISTREAFFPAKLMSESSKGYTPGKKLATEIHRAGFRINQIKTRIQYKDSRQDVTGLVVNKKPAVKCEYWRTVRSQCHALFRTGTFIETKSGIIGKGNIFALEGKLNFIDQVDYFNRRRCKPILNPEYQRTKSEINTRKFLSGRERTFSRFLYYKMFYSPVKPTIICEGKTDNIYLKAAINQLSSAYPKLAIPKTGNVPYELLIQFFNYTSRSKFLLELSGGTSYLREFILKFDDNFRFYKAPNPLHPVIIILDNDSGFNPIESIFKKNLQPTAYPINEDAYAFRDSDFIHIIHNLYAVLTPRPAAKDSAIEDLFPQAVRDKKLGGKVFSSENKFDKTTKYGKEYFASKVVVPNKSTIDFSGFDIILRRIVQCIEHYEELSLNSKR